MSLEVGLLQPSFEFGDLLVVTVARRRGCMLGAPVLRSAVRDRRGPQPSATARPFAAF
jgi:hypothetical protein